MLYPGQDHWPEYLFQSPYVIPVFSFSCPQGIQTIGMFPYKIIKMFVHMYIPLQFGSNPYRKSSTEATLCMFPFGRQFNFRKIMILLIKHTIFFLPSNLPTESFMKQLKLHSREIPKTFNLFPHCDVHSAVDAGQLTLLATLDQRTDCRLRMSLALIIPSRLYCDENWLHILLESE